MTNVEPISQALERFKIISEDCDVSCSDLTAKFIQRMGLEPSPLDDFLSAKLREFILFLHYDTLQQEPTGSRTDRSVVKFLAKEIYKTCAAVNPENHPFDYFRGKPAVICFEPSIHRWSVEAAFASSLALKLCKNPDREAVLQFLPLAYECRALVRNFCQANPEYYD